MDKILELAKLIKEDSLGVIRDYKNNYVDYEFANGAVISHDIVLSDIEKIWGIDLSEYRVDTMFE